MNPNSKTPVLGSSWTQLFLLGLLACTSLSCRLSTGPKVQGDLATASARAKKSELSVSIKTANKSPTSRRVEALRHLQLGLLGGNQ